MKREDILKIAEKVGLIPDTSHPTANTRYMRNKRNMLSIFGSLVADAEREECTKVCATISDKFDDFGGVNDARGARECMKAIRARGEEEPK